MIKPAEGVHMKNLTIGKVAKSAGIGTETVRFYEADVVFHDPAVGIRNRRHGLYN